MIRVPTVVVGHHGDRRVADFRLASQFRLRHVRHADDIAFPNILVEQRLRLGGELWPFHGEVSAAAVIGHADVVHCLLADIPEPPANRIRHTNMGDAPIRKERFLPQKGSVYELIDKDELAGLHVLAEAAAGRHREDIGHPDAFQGIDIGLIWDMARTVDVAPAVPRQESDIQPVERSGEDLVGRGAVRGINRNPATAFDSVNIINS